MNISISSTIRVCCVRSLIEIDALRVYALRNVRQPTEGWLSVRDEDRTPLCSPIRGRLIVGGYTKNRQPETSKQHKATTYSLPLWIVHAINSYDVPTNASNILLKLPPRYDIEEFGEFITRYIASWNRTSAAAALFLYSCTHTARRCCWWLTVLRCIIFIEV